VQAGFFNQVENAAIVGVFKRVQAAKAKRPTMAIRA
jgi:hypothetical protein